VFVLQGDLTLVQDQLAVAKGNIILSLINVYKALGGGWEIFASHVEAPTPAEETDGQGPPAPSVTSPDEPNSEP
jgi:hypothetical protein